MRYALILCIALVSSASSCADALELAGRVERISKIPPGSGIAASWAELFVRKGDKELKAVYIPYGGSETFIPPVGAQCRFLYFLIDIDGAIGGRFGKEKGAMVVQRISCDGGIEGQSKNSSSPRLR